MKKNIRSYLFVSAASALFVFLGCSKTETLNVQEPTPCFSMSVWDQYGSYLRSDSTALIDSVIFFKNCSDTLTATSYEWDFGDGTTAKTQNAEHKYSQRGDYNVTLTVSNQGFVSSKIQKKVHIVLGQQIVSLSNKTLWGIALEETATKEFVLLGSDGYGNAYYLIQLDSLLRQKNIITLPAGYKLNSMRKTNDGNFIFTGTTQGSTEFNELIKMKADGSLLWTKALNVGSSYGFVMQSPDGGYVAAGASTAGNIPVLIKTDNNGVIQKQIFPNIDGIKMISNAVAEQDGIVFAGTTSTNYIGTDSLLMLKADYNGNVLWKSKVYWGLNASNGYTNVRVNKLADGNYAVFCRSTKGIFLFTSTGIFLDRKLSLNEISDFVNSDDGSLMVLQTEWGNGFRAMISKLNLDGSISWTSYPNGQVKLSSGSVMCCADFWPQDIKRLQSGGIILMATRIYSGGKYEILLLELDNYGRPR